MSIEIWWAEYSFYVPYKIRAEIITINRFPYSSNSSGIILHDLLSTEFCGCHGDFISYRVFFIRYRVDESFSLHLWQWELTWITSFNLNTWKKSVITTLKSLNTMFHSKIFSNENLFDHTEPLIRTLVGISHQMHVEIVDLEDPYFGNHKMINFPKTFGKHFWSNVS